MAFVSNGAEGFQGSLPTLLTSRPIVEQAVQKRGRQAFSCAAIKLPEEIEACPGALRVRNTFLDTQEERPPSLEPFYRERSVQTCPGAHAGLLQGLFTEGAYPAGVAAPDMTGFGGQTPLAPMPSPSPYMPVTPSPAAAAGKTIVSLSAMLDLPSAAALAAAPAPALPMDLAPMAPLYSPPVAPPQLPPSSEQSLPSAPPAGPALGSIELPSIGSALHGSGGCKPCAFLYTKGCENGAKCTFCHLCDSEERRRRRKAKVEAQQAIRREKRAEASLQGK